MKIFIHKFQLPTRISSCSIGIQMERNILLVQCNTCETHWGVPLTPRVKYSCLLNDQTCSKYMYTCIKFALTFVGFHWVVDIGTSGKWFFAWSWSLILNYSTRNVELYAMPLNRKNTKNPQILRYSMKHLLNWQLHSFSKVNKIYTKNYSRGCADFQRYIPVTVDHTVV